MGIFKALSLFALTELTSSYITRMALRSKYSTLCTLFTALLVRLNEMKPYLMFFVNLTKIYGFIKNHLSKTCGMLLRK